MQNAVPPRCMPQFLEKLESWLQRLNTPLSNTPCPYTLQPYFTAARHFSTVSAYSFKWYALLGDGYVCVVIGMAGKVDFMMGFVQISKLQSFRKSAV